MKITATGFDPANLECQESVFHTANGYLGVRANFEEGYPVGVATVRGCYINGFYDTVDIRYPEKLYGFPETAQRMVNLPDLQTTKLFFDGEEFSLFKGEVLGFERVLDMEAGTVSRNVHWKSPGGKELRLVFTRMASFVRPEIFLTSISAAGLNCSGELKMVSQADYSVYNFFDEHDPRVASQSERYLHIRSVEISGECASAICDTSKSGLSVSAAMGHSFSQDVKAQTRLTPNGFETTCLLKFGSEPVVIEKFCSYSDSRRESDCAAHAVKTLRSAMAAGAKALFGEQREYVSAFWNENGVAIHGNDEIAQGMAYNLYGLLQSAGRDSIGNIAAKGLSGEGYEGHYFWDTEIYMFPFFLFTRPEHAKSLLEYRYSILESAREQARLLGFERGALYSWRTITGSECSPYYPSGSAQYHITGDVAHSFLQYFAVTGDVGFMAEKGAEVLVETARFWLCAGQYDRKGRLCFNCVTGPDEYTCIVNNNYFTNLSAKNNLLGAVRVCERLEGAGLSDEVFSRLGISRDELLEFEKAANDIFIPYDEKLDINPQDDSFLDKAKCDLASIPKEKFPLLFHFHPLWLYSHQVCKQADTVLAHYLYGDAEESTVRNSYDYYEAITTHDSTLSTCIFSIMASQLEMAEKAYEYFTRTVRTDLDNTHGNTKDGIHTANMGGAYLTLVAGFAGLRVKQDGLHFRFALPEAWSGYDFNLTYKGSLFRVSVRSGGVSFQLSSGEEVPLHVDGEAYTLRDSLSLKGAVH